MILRNQRCKYPGSLPGREGKALHFSSLRKATPPFITNRILSISVMSPSASLVPWKGEKKCGSLAELGLDPDLSVVALHDLLA